MVKMKNYVKIFQNRIKDKLREAIVGNTQGQIDNDDHLYSEMGQANTRDLNTLTFERGVQLSVDLFRKESNCQ